MGYRGASTDDPRRGRGGAASREEEPSTSGQCRSRPRRRRETPSKPVVRAAHDVQRLVVQLEDARDARAGPVADSIAAFDKRNEVVAVGQALRGGQVFLLRPARARRVQRVLLLAPHRARTRSAVQSRRDAHGSTRRRKRACDDFRTFARRVRARAASRADVNASRVRSLVAARGSERSLLRFSSGFSCSGRKSDAPVCLHKAFFVF